MEALDAILDFCQEELLFSIMEETDNLCLCPVHQILVWSCARQLPVEVNALNGKLSSPFIIYHWFSVNFRLELSLVKDKI